MVAEACRTLVPTVSHALMESQGGEPLKRRGFRFTIRLYMIVVAAVTSLVVLGVQSANLLRLRASYLGAAEYHAERQQEEEQKLSNVAVARSRGLGADPLVPIVENLARSRLSYHADMKRKWQRAASHPWEFFVPDPPEPTDPRLVERFNPTPLPLIRDDIPTLTDTGQGDEPAVEK
jgi:hypothetical protein